MSVTLAEVYVYYRACGGTRLLENRVIRFVGKTDVANLDRSWLLERGRQLYPNPEEWVEKFAAPSGEILGDLSPVESATRELEVRQYFEWVRRPAVKDPNYDWERIERDATAYERHRGSSWASITPPKAPRPPPDPSPCSDNHYIGSTDSQWWMYDHRGQLSKARLKDGKQCRIGPPPKNSRPVYEGGAYVGYRPGGRPRKYQSNAERQRAYRQRKRSSSESHQNDDSTIGQRIEEMLALYEALNGEANHLIDQYVEEVAAPRCPGIPKGVVRALEIDNRIGGMLNYREALRFLRQARA